MRHVNLLSLVLLFGCMQPEGKEEHKSTEKKEEDTVSASETIPIPKSEDIPDTNFTDTKGLKQGLWIEETRHAKFHNYYKDGKLEGKQIKNYGWGFDISQFKNGKLHGHSTTYTTDSTPRYTVFFEADTAVWHAFNWELDDFVVPIKGWYTKRDSVYMEVYYDSGQMMYEGWITNEHSQFPAFGIHKAYFRNGKLKAVVDYDLSIAEIFLPNGKTHFSGDVRSWCGRRVPENPK